MSNDQATKQPDSNAVQANTEARLKELTNVNRIVTNALNLIVDVEIKGGHAGPVAEIIGWLTGFSQSLTSQIKTLESTLPKKAITPKVVPGKDSEAAKATKTVDAEVKEPAVESKA